MRNNLLIICCSVVGIAAGAWYNHATAYELPVVTGEHEIVTMIEQEMTSKGKWKTVSKQRMIKSDCIDHSYKMAQQWRAVDCKSDPVKIKRQSNGRWGVSLP